MVVFCAECEKVFSNQSSLNRHRREVHNMNNSILSYKADNSNYKFLCGKQNCNTSFINAMNLRQHLFDVHNINGLTVNERNFPSKKEFENWFLSEQRNSNTSYYLLTIKRGHDEEISYYYCNRSGKSQLKPVESRKRSLKSQGSCKINKYCTSQLILRRNILSDKCSIQYFSKHYGHDIEVQHVRIHKSDRELIASKLIAGVSASNVLNKTRSEVGTGETLKRVDLLVRKDINNIKNAYDINVIDGCRHKNDSTSVQLFVSECEKNEFNPIAFYKAQGVLAKQYNLKENDFCIIIITEMQLQMLKKFGGNIITIDATHGLNSYDFEMSTLMVIDEYGEGFPAACMYANRKDSYIYEVFFSELKAKVGHINAKVFMSDIAPAFYNGWCKIMSPVEHRLLCAWHVDRGWRTNLQKIKDTDQRYSVYKTLKYIQYLLDEDIFECEINKFIIYLNDASLLEFRKYFLDNYFNIKHQWAYAYRKQCNVNTNMHLESMHKALKYIYFDGKKIKRLDKSINVLLKFIRDKTVERLIKATKGKTTNQRTQIHARHRAVACSSDYELESDTQTKGIVRNTKTSEMYFIELRSLSECCEIKCSFCHICVHSCSCTCIDFVIRSTICKHIHFFLLNSKTVGNLARQSPATNIKADIDNSTAIVKLINNKSIISLKDEIHSNALDIAKKIKSHDYTPEQVTAISKHLKIIAAVESLPLPTDDLSVKKLKLIPTKGTVSEPSNKNIKKQISFFSTKKKNKKSDRGYRKPNWYEQLAIKGILNDHNYY